MDIVLSLSTVDIAPVSQNATLGWRDLVSGTELPPFTEMHVSCLALFSFLTELQLYYKTKREDRVQFMGCLCRISQHSAAHAFLSIVKPNSSYILACKK